MVELIAVIGLLGAVSAGMAGLFVTLIADIPRAKRAMDANSVVSGMLIEMRKDVASARSLPKAVGKVQANENTLWIQLPDKTVCYELKDGKVIKCKVSPDGKSSILQTWTAPNAKIRWAVRRQGGRGYAVEVKTHVEVRIADRRLKKLANAHVFFMNKAPAG